MKLKNLTILALLGMIFILSALPVLAQLDVGLDYGTYTGLGTKDIRAGVMTIVNVLLGFLGIIAIIGILAGGFLMMIAGGNQEKTDSGKKAVTAGVIGLVIIFIAYAIATFVINSLITATGAG
jgi:uncharacterized membrane protein